MPMYVTVGFRRPFHVEDSRYSTWPETRTEGYNYGYMSIEFISWSDKRPHSRTHRGRKAASCKGANGEVEGLVSFAFGEGIVRCLVNQAINSASQFS